MICLKKKGADGALFFLFGFGDLSLLDRFTSKASGFLFCFPKGGANLVKVRKSQIRFGKKYYIMTCVLKIKHKNQLLIVIFYKFYFLYLGHNAMGIVSVA